jgi:dephospho-CoA kinase
MTTTQMQRIALTGGMGTGKSHVRAVFAALGVPTIDADTLARDVVAHGTPGFDAVVAAFGRGILNADGDLDRRALAALVFADTARRRDLEAILHPAIRGAIDQWFASLTRPRSRSPSPTSRCSTRSASTRIRRGS